MVVNLPKLQSAEEEISAEMTMSQKTPMVLPKLQSTSNNDKVYEDRNDGA